MKRLLFGFLLCLALISLTGNERISALSDLDQPDLGKVIEIIDGEVLKVFFYRHNYERPAVELVKVIGMDTLGSKEAFEYVSNRVLGRTIFFLYEEGSYQPGNMRHAHVFVDYDQTLAEEILKLGAAKVDPAYKETRYYQNYLAAENEARLNEIGFFETSLSRTTDRININTADTQLLMQELDLTYDLAFKIANYRSYNPFNSATEIMAVDSSFDEAWYKAHSHLLSVITNVNRASYLELTSLLPLSVNKDYVIDDLQFYLKFNNIENLDDLKSVEVLAPYYESIKPFITTKAISVYEEDESKSKYININTVSLDSFKIATGLDESAFKRLLAYRLGNDSNESYRISSLSEITKGSNPLIVPSLLFMYSNKLRTVTNVNTAGTNELRSLFESSHLNSIDQQNLVTKIIQGRPYNMISQLKPILGNQLYEELRPLVYVYESDFLPRYNSNTVAQEDLARIKIAFNGLYTKYTNINKASRNELLAINKEMSEDLVDAIIEYRSRYPFRNNGDLLNLFSKYGKLALHNRISYYLTYE